MDALSKFKEVMVGIYKFMTDCEMVVFGFQCTLWDLYLYGFVAFVGLFIFLKIIRS